jgi:hypothetical protein
MDAARQRIFALLAVVADDVDAALALADLAAFHHAVDLGHDGGFARLARFEQFDHAWQTTRDVLGLGGFARDLGQHIARVDFVAVANQQMQSISGVTIWTMLKVAPILATVAATMALCSCDRAASLSMSASERFQLEVKCADEAREFESQWKKDNGTDFEMMLFRHHYNLLKGKCYSLVYVGTNTGLTSEMVYDALAGVTKMPLVILMAGNDKAANESEDHKKIAKTIREYMEDDTP